MTEEVTNVVEVEILYTTPSELDEQVEWYFNAKAANGEIVSTSERYPTRSNAKRGAAAVFPGIRMTFQGEDTTLDD